MTATVIPLPGAHLAAIAANARASLDALGGYADDQHPAIYAALDAIGRPPRLVRARCRVALYAWAQAAGAVLASYDTDASPNHRRYWTARDDVSVVLKALAPAAPGVGRHQWGERLEAAVTELRHLLNGHLPAYLPGDVTPDAAVEADVATWTYDAIDAVAWLTVHGWPTATTTPKAAA